FRHATALLQQCLIICKSCKDIGLAQRELDFPPLVIVTHYEVFYLQGPSVRSGLLAADRLTVPHLPTIRYLAPFLSLSAKLQAVAAVA
ncbi:hypothetical protein LTR28_007929, partial [Elasticomyces elasticus]